jgi:hypothetical protein
MDLILVTVIYFIPKLIPLHTIIGPESSPELQNFYQIIKQIMNRKGLVSYLFNQIFGMSMI